MKKKSLFNSVLVLIISQVMVKILGLVYKLYLANKQGFGDTGNAIYNSGYQIYVLLLTVSSIGIPNAVAKLISEKYYKGSNNEILEILKESLIIFSVIGLSFSIFLATFSGIISEKLLNISESRYSLIVLAPAIFNVCVISVYRGFYNGTQNIKITARSQTIEQVFKTVFTIGLVEFVFNISNSNTVAMATTANIATTLATFGSLGYLSKKNNLKIMKSTIKWKNIKRILAISLPISMSTVLASLNKNIDSFTVVRFLKKNITEKEAKMQYGLLSGKVDILASVPISFVIAIATTIIPVISMLYSQGNRAKLNEIVKTYLLFTVLAILPCSIGMIAFSDKILLLLFNSSNGSLCFKICAVSLLFISIEQIVHAVLQGIGNVFIPTMSLSVGVIVKLFLNIYLISIPENILVAGGINGACIATVACHIIACTISFTVLKKKIKISLKISKYLLKPFCASCIMLVSLYFSYYFFRCILIENIAIILAISVAVIMYVISVFLLKILNADEINLIPFMSNFAVFNKKIRNNKEKRRILHNFGE